MTATSTATTVTPTRRRKPPSPAECLALAAAFEASLPARPGRWHRLLVRLTLVQVYRGEERWVGRG